MTDLEKLKSAEFKSIALAKLAVKFREFPNLTWFLEFAHDLNFSKILLLNEML